MSEENINKNIFKDEEFSEKKDNCMQLGKQEYYIEIPPVASQELKNVSHVRKRESKRKKK